eukprot:97912_1
MTEYCNTNKENNNMNINNVNNNINIKYKKCDLNAYNFNAPTCKNETVKFYVEMQENNNLTMTERYEKLQQQQMERMKKINKMKEEYNKIAKDLNTYYSFRAKLFQDTTSTDYALFQLESIKQKLKSKNELKNEKYVQLMEDDGIDNLLNSISD